MRAFGLCGTCYRRDYWQKNKAKFQGLARDRHLRNTYGLSNKKYEALVAKQGGNCASCRDPLPTVDKRQRRRSAHVDHNHTTGDVRGVLCSGCNTSLGGLKESPRRAQALITYMKKHGCVDV